VPPETEVEVEAVTPGPGECALAVEEVSVTFGGVAALSNVTLRAEAGRVTGLIGPNGAGKTTLFNVISGLQRPDQGSVHLAGTEVTRKGTHRRARLGLARTFQRLELFSTLSAADNVRVGLEAGGKAEAATAVSLLERVGVADEAHAQVSSLPTGSARLVELARALSTDPKVLLLDEPCSGLDEHESEALGRLLTSLAEEGRAVLIVEHDTDLVLRVCDTVHVLDFGQVIASGTPDEIRNNPAVQEAYLGHATEPVDAAGTVDAVGSLEAEAAQDGEVS
jgi:branched-chain amino acid transport system ATP-binding protein